MPLRIADFGDFRACTLSKEVKFKKKKCSASIVVSASIEIEPVESINQSINQLIDRSERRIAYVIMGGLAKQI